MRLDSGADVPRVSFGETVHTYKDVAEQNHDEVLGIPNSHNGSGDVQFSFRAGAVEEGGIPARKGHGTNGTYPSRRDDTRSS